LAISSSISDEADVVVWEDNTDAKAVESAGETVTARKEESVDDTVSSSEPEVAA